MEISTLVSAFFDTAGPGGVVVIGVITLALFIYYFLARWIVAGGNDETRSPQHEP